jgi:hypothetical protein
MFGKSFLNLSSLTTIAVISEGSGNSTLRRKALQIQDVRSRLGSVPVLRHEYRVTLSSSLFVTRMPLEFSLLSGQINLGGGRGGK